MVCELMTGKHVKTSFFDNRGFPAERMNNIKKSIQNIIRELTRSLQQTTNGTK